MCLLIYGTAVYNGSVRLSWLSYPDDEEDDDANAVSATPTMERVMSSPLIQRSPFINAKGAGITGTPVMGKGLPTTRKGGKGYGSTSWISNPFSSSKKKRGQGYQEVSQTP